MATGSPGEHRQEHRARSRADDRASPDPRGRYVLRPEWIRAETVVNAGLIVVGIYFVQSLLAASFGDTAARISVIAWAVAIPFLAALGLLNVTQESYRFVSYPAYLLIARAIAQGTAAVGIAAAFWHIWMPAAIVLIVSTLAALALFVFYARRLEKDNRAN